MPSEESNSLRTQVLPLSLLRLSFVPSSNNYLLSAYCVLGAALGTWYKLGNRTKILPSRTLCYIQSVCAGARDTNSKHNTV